MKTETEVENVKRFGQASLLSITFGTFQACFLASLRLVQNILMWMLSAFYVAEVSTKCFHFYKSFIPLYRTLVMSFFQQGPWRFWIDNEPLSTSQPYSKNVIVINSRNGQIAFFISATGLFSCLAFELLPRSFLIWCLNIIKMMVFLAPGYHTTLNILKFQSSMSGHIFSMETIMLDNHEHSNTLVGVIAENIIQTTIIWSFVGEGRSPTPLSAKFYFIFRNFSSVRNCPEAMTCMFRVTATLQQPSVTLLDQILAEIFFTWRMQLWLENFSFSFCNVLRKFCGCAYVFLLVKPQSLWLLYPIYYLKFLESAGV